MAAAGAHGEVEAVWKIEAPRLVAGLTRLVRDLSLAEDLAQDALVAALEQWPRDGIPVNPGAWLTAVAKHRALNVHRHGALVDSKHKELSLALQDQQQATDMDLDTTLDDDIGDDLLRLVFMSCHPVLPTEARVALTLKVLGGLTTEEIARAFLVPEPTIAQRIVRAKRTLADAGVPFAVPRGPERRQRLASVLEVIYFIFNEGYAATAGDDWVRPELCTDALRLGRVLAGLEPDEAEVHGLVALMELTASRMAARTDAAGTPVLLLDQNRARWDRLLIERGVAALARAESLGGARGPYALQAAISACHAVARTPQATPWSRIAALYAELAEVMPSPVVELNRAVAVSMADGPAAGLALLDTLASDPSLKDYPFLPSARGDILSRLGRWSEARIEFERAAKLTSNRRDEALLLERAAHCARQAAARPSA